MGLNHYSWGVNVPCSRTHHVATNGDRTQDLSSRSSNSTTSPPFSINDQSNNFSVVIGTTSAHSVTPGKAYLIRIL